MAEATSAAIAGIKLATVIPDLVKKILERGDMRRENPTELGRLHEDIKFSQDTLTKAISAFEEVDRNPSMKPPAPWPMVQDKLSMSQNILQRVEQDCHQLETAGKRNSIFPSRLRNKMKALNEKLDKLHENLQSVYNAIQNVQPALHTLSVRRSSSDVQRDSFIVVRNVPCNPHDVCLDFASRDENGTPLTHEAQLKDAIFDESDQRAVAAVARGIGGVGKTCALRAIGRLEETERMFTGGILHMVIGADGGLSRLIENIADIVERAGGRTKADRIRDKNTLLEATSLAGEWFQDYACLFLIDDIWCTNGITRESVHQLSDLAKHPKSRIAFTARDTKVEFEREIEFEERASYGEQSRSILLRCAGLPSPARTDACDAFNNILKTCNGLPIALSVCGRAVRQYAKKRCAGCPESAWVQYWERYRDQPVLSADSRDSAEGMRRSVQLSLDFIDEESNIGSSRRLFTAFCVLRKQQFVPSGVMQRLWGVSSNEAENFIDDLERFSIVQVRYSENDGKTSVALHDVLLDISRELASKEGTLKQWCMSLIVSYATTANGGVSHLDQEVERFERLSEWWMRVDDDGYIFGNMCWLLKHGEFRETLFELICNPEWSIKQLRSNGERQVEEDVQFCSSCLPRSLLGNEKARVERFLKVLQRTAEMSGKEVRGSSWDGMAWYQFYGRMVHLIDRNEYVGRFLEKVEGGAPRPWLRPGPGCVPAAGDSLRAVIDVEGDILCMMQVGESVIVCYEVERRVLLTKRYDMEKRTESAEETVLEAVEENDMYTVVQCARFSSSGELLVVGMRNGDILLCQISGHGATTSTRPSESGTAKVFTDVNPNNDCCESENEHSNKKYSCFRCKCEYSILRGEGARVMCVEFNEKKMQIVCGASDGMLRIWERGGDKWTSTRLEGHEDSVLSVATSGNGQLVVSGSLDHTLRVWERDGDKWTNTRLDGHEGSVWSVATSGNGRLVVSGSSDRTLGVWERDGDKWTSTRLEGHEAVVESLATSLNGRRILSGSYDGTLRVWERDGNKWTSTRLEGHEGPVKSVTTSGNGQLVVSGSVDHTLRVWERDGDKWTSTRLDGHEGLVWSVATSGNGQLVVSGSSDRTLRVWKRDGDKWTSTKLEAHGEIYNVETSANGQCVVAKLSGGLRRMWSWKDGEWSEEACDEENRNSLRSSTGQNWYLDDSLYDEVRRLFLGSDIWKTAFGYFVAVHRPPFLVQIDVLYE